MDSLICSQQFVGRSIEKERDKTGKIPLKKFEFYLCQYENVQYMIYIYMYMIYMHIYIMKLNNDQVTNMSNRLFSKFGN